jgi:hypothetical protein
MVKDAGSAVSRFRIYDAGQVRRSVSLCIDQTSNHLPFTINHPLTINHLPFTIFSNLP